ncbi:MAG: hypothetical protein EOP84_08285 [Verrucomicrobiaceae bacterium]|nr:MAG: hypothetical protein EOP84_08285 [Verrucomicrobiaceae bacterium]
MKVTMHRILSASFFAVVLSGCSVTWVQHPGVVGKDGSRIVVTTYDKQIGQDRLVIERFDKDGNRSVHVIEGLPESLDSFTTEAAASSVTLRLFNKEKQVIDQRSVPFSSFITKGR